MAAYDFSHNNNGGCAPVPEEGDQVTPSTVTVPGARGSRRSSHDTSTEYSKKPKTQSGKKKSHKGRSHH